jgi:uncharacterized protein YegP (UPF0339 family)
MIFEIIHANGLIKSKYTPYFYFNLKAGNGEIIATSEMYESKQACKKGIASVKKCLFARIVDKT